MRDCGSKVFADMLPNIQPNQIRQTESCSLRPPHQRSRERVHFIHCVIILNDVVHSKSTHAKENTVADEIGRIFTQHNSFTQAIFTEQRYKLNNFLISIFCWDNFQQLQIAWRIKKVCPKKM